jgi:hypothetical protein
MIGGTYEYLLSSLPNLSFQKTEESREEVLGLLAKYAGSAADNLSPVQMLDGEVEKFLPAALLSTFKKMHLANIHREEFRNSKVALLAGFASFTYELRHKLQAWRIARQNGESQAGHNEQVALLGDGNPLEQEVRFIKLQWRELEDLAAGHFSDADTVFGYKIQLMLLLRWWSFNSEKGFEKFKQLTTTQ